MHEFCYFDIDLLLPDHNVVFLIIVTQNNEIIGGNTPQHFSCTQFVTNGSGIIDKDLIAVFIPENIVDIFKISKINIAQRIFFSRLCE